MVSGQLIDTILLIYFSYALFVGIKHGLFHVIVSIFGIYGAWFFAWLFRHQAYLFFNGFLSISISENSIYFFLFLWIIFYFLTYFLAKVVTFAFKLSGINFLLRFLGGFLNLLKAVLIVTVVLTFISSFKVQLYEPTQLTSAIIKVGSNMMKVYRSSTDEKQLDLDMIKEVKPESLIQDDFRYNLLER